jgi:hypothetical protein
LDLKSYSTKNIFQNSFTPIFDCFFFSWYSTTNLCQR